MSECLPMEWKPIFAELSELEEGESRFIEVQDGHTPLKFAGNCRAALAQSLYTRNDHWFVSSNHGGKSIKVTKGRRWESSTETHAVTERTTETLSVERTVTVESSRQPDPPPVIQAVIAAAVEDASPEDAPEVPEFIRESLRYHLSEVDELTDADAERHFEHIEKLAEEIKAWREVQSEVDQCVASVVDVFPAMPEEAINAVRHALQSFARARRLLERHVRRSLKTIRRGGNPCLADSIGELLPDADRIKYDEGLSQDRDDAPEGVGD